MESRILAATTRLAQSPPPQSMEPWLHLDLTAAQIRTLAVLREDKPLTIGRVADFLGITLPTASHLVDKLVRAGFAERSDDPLDRRRAVVRPSARGAALMRGLREINQSYLQACLARMADADVAALLQGMAALADTAEAIKREADTSEQPSEAKEPTHA
jgi:DNA-binding MarR family transcriptional regulator